jgi:6-phosphofructokinase 2
LDELAAIEAAAQQVLAENRVAVLVVSLGSGGALLATASSLLRIPSPQVRVNSKVGAGDSLVGALVLGLARGMELPEAVRYGIAAGTAAVLTPGTELCRREDVERLYLEMEKGGSKRSL